MGKKSSNLKKSTKIEPEYRTIEERKDEVRIIIEKLNELKLSIHHEPIKKLFVMMQRYIQEGERIKVNIPFPVMGRRIKGILAINKREEVWVMMEQEKF